jgi:hypothetical protein
MKVQRLSAIFGLRGFLGASALAWIGMSSSVAQAALTSCLAEGAFLDLLECQDRTTGEAIGQSRGVVVDGDQFLSIQTGINGGGFSNFEIVQTQVEERDANGALLEDCRFVNNEPRGVFIFGFGAASPACDTAVAQQTLIFYDNEVRLTR